MKTPEEIKAAKHAYYLRTQEHTKARVRAYQLAHREEISRKNKERRKKNPEYYRRISKERYEKNKAHISERQKARRQENLEEARAKDRARYEREKDARCIRQMLYYWENPEKYKHAARKYAENHPERIQAHSRNYRRDNLEYLRKYDRERAKNLTPARKIAHKRWRIEHRDLPIAHAKIIRSSALALFGTRCSWCGYDAHPEVLQFDHVQPLHKLRLKRSGNMSAKEVLRTPALYDLLCQNCHATKTNMDKRSKSPTKGSIAYRMKRASLLAEHGAECATCGYSENVLALQFDHVKPLLGQARKPAHMEAKKGVELQLQCANCHALKTIQDLLARRDERRRRERELVSTIPRVRMPRHA